MECKFVIATDCGISSVCFNLNLLECKSEMQTSAVQKTCVLISTYWNVNTFTIQPFISRLSFNLNLLECKFMSANRSCSAGDGFNLNLLECKYPLSVLHRLYVCGFNLNLLECKFICLLIWYSSAIVLISTYWNVNCDKIIFKQLPAYVLISTYWNVNYSILSALSIDVTQKE